MSQVFLDIQYVPLRKSNSSTWTLADTEKVRKASQDNCLYCHLFTMYTKVNSFKIIKWFLCRQWLKPLDPFRSLLQKQRQQENLSKVTNKHILVCPRNSFISILYSSLLHKMNFYFLDRQYIFLNTFKT